MSGCPSNDPWNKYKLTALQSWRYGVLYGSERFSTEYLVCLRLWYMRTSHVLNAIPYMPSTFKPLRHWCALRVQRSERTSGLGVGVGSASIDVFCAWLRKAKCLNSNPSCCLNTRSQLFWRGAMMQRRSGWFNKINRLLLQLYWV